MTIRKRIASIDIFMFASIADNTMLSMIIIVCYLYFVNKKVIIQLSTKAYYVYM